MSPTSRLVALAAAAALVVPVGAAPATASPAPAAPTTSRLSTADQPAPRLVRTPFAFRANGYGTSASGGQIPVGSDRTALSSIACTSEAGKRHRNFVEESEIPGLGTVRGVYSRVTTKRKGTAFLSTSRHKVAEIVLAETPLGSLSISGVVSATQAENDKGTFSARANTKIAGITFTPPVGDPQTLEIPSPGQPLEIPGLAVITLGRTIEKATADHARAYAVGLTIKVIPTDTVVKVARSAAKMERGFKSGIFHGSGIPAKANVLGELVEVGRVIRQVMPCTGTGGELDEADAADINLGDQVVVEGASARQKGKQTRKKATGMESSFVARLDLGGQLQVEAIRSKVKVTRIGNRLKRSGGATFGSITFGGEPQSLEELDGLEIPGLAKIETGLKRKIKDGIRVVGVRITLLDGTGAVIDLATSKLSISDR